MSGLETDWPDLLPPNATPLEKALAGPTGRLDNAIDVPIDTLLNAWTCPADFLPWLAWHLSLDLWDWKWDEFKKRSVISKAIELARSKGTLNGLRKHCAVMDTEVVQVVRPPQGTFASASLTKGEYDAWLRTMPQIRVYLAREQGSAKGLLFLRPAEGTPASETTMFLDHGFGRFDGGRSLYGRAARLWDRDVETPLYIWDVHTERQIADGKRIERVSIPGKGGKALFAGRFVDHYFLGSVEKEAQLVTYQQDVTYEHSSSELSMRTATSGLEPVDVRSERVSDTGYASQHAFAGRFLVEQPPLSGSTTKQIFAADDTAPWMLYDRIVLHDRGRAVPKLEAWSFLNFSRLGYSPYTAKAVIDLKDKMHRGAFTANSFVSRGWYLQEEDTTKRDSAHRAVRVSKAARDKILSHIS